MAKVVPLLMSWMLVFLLIVSVSTACKCRDGNKNCWIKCARIYQSKRQAGSPLPENTLQDILKQSTQKGDRYPGVEEDFLRNSAESPRLDQLAHSLPPTWRRNMYRLMKEAELEELENYL